MNYSLSGIRKLFYATIEYDSLNYFISSGNTIIIPNGITFNELVFETANFSQKRTADSKGAYYSKEFTLTFADISSSIQLEGAKVVIIFEDNNCNTWITGHEKVFSIGKKEDQTGGNENKIDLSLVQNSYLPIQQINLAINNVNISASTNFCTSNKCYTSCNCASGSTGNFVTVPTFNSYTASTNSILNNKLNVSSFNLYSGTTLTLINSKLSTSSFNTYSGITNTRISTIETKYVSGATNLGGVGLYSTKTNRNLNLKGLVAGSNISLTPSSTGITIASTNSVTANNGLTKNGSNIRLGGFLTGDTLIVATGKTLTIQDAFSFYASTLNGGNHTDLFLNSSTISMQRNYGDAIFIDTAGPKLQGTINDITVTLSSGLKMVYAADYSAYFTNRSLVDKGYVLGIVGGTGLTANNGLTKTGSNIRLGGSLTGNTIIGLGSSNLTFTGSTGIVKLGTTLIGGTIITPNTILDVRGIGTTTGTTFRLASNSNVPILLVKDNKSIIYAGTSANTFTFSGTTGFKGAQYLADYSGSYTARSIPDVGFITSSNASFVSGATNLGTTGNAIFAQKNGRNLEFKKLAAGTNISLTSTSTGVTVGTTGVVTSANNGLTKTGSNIILGGSLTGNTIVGLGSSNLTFTGSTGILKLGTTLIGGTTITTNTRLDVRGIGTTTANLVRFADNANTPILTITDNKAASYAGSSANTFTFSGTTGFKGAQYGADYSANYVDRSIPDVSFVDARRLKSITHSSVVDLDKNYRSVLTITGAIGYTKGVTTHIVSNEREDWLTANGVNKPTFNATDFVVVWDNWVNTNTQLNLVKFKYRPDGKFSVYLQAQ